MKNIHTLFALPLLSMILLLCACGKKTEAPIDQDAQRAIDIQKERDAKKQVIRFQPTSYTDSISKGGHHYSFTIERSPLDSTQLVTDTEGFRANDNTVKLTVKRDGAPLFSRTFTRAAFKIGISDEEFSHYILMNMVFDRITDNGLQFIVSLGEASSDDMFVQYAVTVASDGSTNITRHEMFDDDEIDRVEDEGV